MLTGQSEIDEDMYQFFHDHLESEWKKCDIDGDGSISVPEFRVYLQKFFKEREMEGTLKALKTEDVKNMMKEVDTDNSGAIDKDEFFKMMNMSSRLHEAIQHRHWNIVRKVREAPKTGGCAKDWGVIKTEGERKTGEERSDELSWSRTLQTTMYNKVQSNVKHISSFLLLASLVVVVAAAHRREARRGRTRRHARPDPSSLRSHDEGSGGDHAQARPRQRRLPRQEDGLEEGRDRHDSFLSCNFSV